MIPFGVLAGAAVLAAAGASRAAAGWWSTARVAGRLVPAGAAPRPGPPVIERALARAGVTIGAHAALRLWAAGVAVALAAAVVAPGGAVLAGVGVGGPPVALFAARGRAARLRTRQLPVALDAVAARLRGGAALRVAVADAAAVGAPLGTELARVASHAAAGRPLADALAEWADTDEPATRLAGAALVVAAELGGPGAAAIDATAASLRERHAVDDEIAALSVQARLSALLLTVAPIAFAALLTTLDPTSARFLLGTPAGWACIGAGTTLDLLGALWMARLVRRAR